MDLLTILGITVIWLLISAAILALLIWQFSNLYSLWLGAPAVSSPAHRLWLQLATKDQVWLDLGCGSGSFCLAAAPYVQHIYGLERSPFYYWLSRWRTRHVTNITILQMDMHRGAWPRADVIYCYLYPDLLGRLDERLRQVPSLVLSYAFPIPGRRAKRIIEPSPGSGRSASLYVY